jgi:hypothetical protein
MNKPPMKQQQQEPVQEQEMDVAEDLNINDLNALKQIIEVTNSRGSYKAAEMEAVGKIYNKLSNFLSQATSKEDNNG